MHPATYTATHRNLFLATHAVSGNSPLCEAAGRQWPGTQREPGTPGLCDAIDHLCSDVRPLLALRTPPRQVHVYYGRDSPGLDSHVDPLSDWWLEVLGDWWPCHTGLSGGTWIAFGLEEQRVSLLRSDCVNLTIALAGGRERAILDKVVSY